ncbi:VanZ family protein [Puniceicoccaceae bacterium K14]|nr:VanZ family protein [Puniceicoccaceae bacterium K14]
MLRYIFPISFFAFICWLIYQADTAQSNVFLKLSNSIPHGDKLGHVLLYGTLALSLNLALSFRKIQILKLSLHLGSVIVFTFALAEEVSQGYFQTRNQDFNDILANMIGICLFTLIGKRLFMIFKRS